MVTLSTLAVGDVLASPRLQELLDLTPGNLVTHLHETHLRKLEDAGYVETRDGFFAAARFALARLGRQPAGPGT
ncbi:MAG TPA: hypothetical protein VLW50_16070 [Streptosporangiaceae bacterium]|nr:hypothetical protein [Streptosporangiaceae bacterium]